MAVAQIGRHLRRRHEVEEVLFDSNEWAEEESISGKLKHAFSMVRNPLAINEVKQTITDFRPDIIILHNVMPVGSSMLYNSLVHSGIPIIKYIHNFRPYSVNGYCWADQKLEPRGLDKNYLPEIIAGSWQGSRLKTAWYAMQLWGLHALKVYDEIDGWIAISKFMANRFVGSGVDPSKVVVIPHSWEINDDALSNDVAAICNTNPPYFLFLGRIAEEKGVLALLNAWRICKEDGVDGKLIIAGDGPLASEVKRLSKSLEDVEYKAFVQGPEKEILLRECRAVIIPSIWWEPLGLVIFEAYEYGKPVLAAKSGGIVDHVEDKVTGWLHEPGNVVELSQHIKAASEQENHCREMGASGRKYLEKQNVDSWLDKIDEFFTSTINRHNLLLSKDGDGNASNRRKELRVSAYLADQNPGLGRSLGISRMTEVVLSSLSEFHDVELSGVVSKSSVRLPDANKSNEFVLPWSTRPKASRILTDHLHSVLVAPRKRVDINYFPKGFMPKLYLAESPAVATIHDTIIQYYQDKYPKWRLELEYNYWAGMLRNTLRHASAILTVSEHAKRQIIDFINRHNLEETKVYVTYEPCLYEDIPQPVAPAKAGYVLHLGSNEPHKRTAWLIRLWARWTVERRILKGKELPQLHIVGNIPEEVRSLASQTSSIVYLPFLEDNALRSQFTAASALILPSEIEGFGLPALEAYYMGTPVCFQLGTSVEEILGSAGLSGGFVYDDGEGLFEALNDVLSMSPDEVRVFGLNLRKTYHSKRIVERMMSVFKGVANRPR